jgi:hypothetical protein
MPRDQPEEHLPEPCVDLPLGVRRSLVFQWRHNMGRGILLWLLGIPLPIVILLVLFLR